MLTKAFYDNLTGVIRGIGFFYIHSVRFLLVLLKILALLSPEAKKLAEEAKRQGKWLYDPSYRKWYSPEDFEHIFCYANASDEFLKQLQIKDPDEGINAGFHQLVELQNRVQIFVLRVKEYYSKNRK